jgi:hypothetical protein
VFGDHLAKLRFGQISRGELFFSKEQAPKVIPPALRDVLNQGSIERDRPLSAKTNSCDPGHEAESNPVVAGKTGIDFFDDTPVSRRLQVSDDALEISLSHPCHDSPEVNSRLKVSGGKCRAELVQPEVIWVQSGLHGIAFESTKHVGVASSAGC